MQLTEILPDQLITLTGNYTLKTEMVLNLASIYYESQTSKVLSVITDTAPIVSQYNLPIIRSFLTLLRVREVYTFKGGEPFDINLAMSKLDKYEDTNIRRVETSLS